MKAENILHKTGINNIKMVFNLFIFPNAIIQSEVY